MFLDTQYAYIVGCAILFGLFWLPLYLRCKSLRKEMLLMSTLAAPLGPLTTLFYWSDYWQPQYAIPQLVGLEDFIFSFLIGGVAGVVYEGFFGKRQSRPFVKNKKLWALGAFPIGIVWMYGGAVLLDFNSIYTSILLLITLGLLLIFIRPDLARPAGFSAVLTALMIFVVYQVWLFLYPALIVEWWNIENLSGIFVWRVPIEELGWAAAWGFFAGPIFEFVAGSRYIQTNKRI